MTDYNNSTQLNHWTFSKEQLNKIRQKAHDQIVKSIIFKERENKTALSQPSEDDQSNSHSVVGTPISTQAQSVMTTPASSAITLESKNPCSLDNFTPTRDELERYLSVEEELVLLNYFLSRLFEENVDYIHTGISVQSIQFCAASYVKRFFLEHSILQYDPLLLIASSVLLAYKADEFTTVDVHKIARTFNKQSDDIIETEQKLLYALKYEITIHTPCRLLRAIETLLAEIALQDEYKTVLMPSSLDNLKRNASQLLIDVYTTDLDLIYSPSVLTFFVYFITIRQLPDGEALFGHLIDRAKQDGSLVSDGSNEKILQQMARVKEDFDAFKAMISSYALKKVNRRWKASREYDRIEPKKRPSSAISTGQDTESTHPNSVNNNPVHSFPVCFNKRKYKVTRYSDDFQEREETV